MIPTAFQVKRALLYPKILLGRYRQRSYPLYRRRYDPLDDTIYRRSTSELIALMMENPDLLHEVGADEGDDVLDVGAYGGEWARGVHGLYPEAKVHCFDLSPGIAAELESRVAGVPGILAYGFGLGGSNREVKISRKYLGSSTMNIKRREIFDVGQMRDVAEVWDELGLSDVAAVKINIEGGEFELLERMVEADLLPRVDTYLIQFHEAVRGSHRRRRRIRKALARTHLNTWDYYFAWERWDRIES